jgi:hypothetical protein
VHRLGSNLVTGPAFVAGTYYRLQFATGPLTVSGIGLLVVAAGLVLRAVESRNEPGGGFPSARDMIGLLQRRRGDVGSRAYRIRERYGTE